MTIQYAGQTFPAYRCQTCGMRSSDPADIERCEKRHVLKDLACKGRVGRRVTPNGKANLVKLKMCGVCGKPGWCATHYRQDRRAKGMRDDRL